MGKIEIVEKLKQARIESHMTQKEAADLLGMTERGKDFLTDQAEICYKQFALSVSKEGSA